MGLESLTTSGLKAPLPYKFEYGQKYFLEKVKKESWREYLFSNLMAATAVSTTFIAAAGLIATAVSGAAVLATPFIIAAVIAPPILTIAAPVINRLISGTGTERDPRLYVERMRDNYKLDHVKPVPDEISTEFFRRPSLKHMAAAGLAGLAIGAISFAFPIAPVLAVAAMFGTALLGASLGGVASATIPSTLERLHFESHVAGLGDDYMPVPAEYVIEEAQVAQLKNKSKQVELATKALEHSSKSDEGMSSDNIRAIIESRGDKATNTFVEQVMDKRKSQSEIKLSIGG